ncbi:putative LacI family transcriptional regulator [Streptomyces sp. Tu6071]|nr:putative LacI family transcriptional regulator [Streptomyces sp. Tu6071]
MLVVIDHVRDGLDRHARQLRDVLEAHPHENPSASLRVPASGRVRHDPGQ